MKDKTTQTIMRQAYTPAELRIREAAQGEPPSRTIEGYAILFGTPSAPLWEDGESVAREVIAPEAVTRELLDKSDIKMTLFHDRHLLLARSNKGAGTLAYHIDERGVRFTFDAPHTADGDKALELVRRGDIAGCSFAFTTRYGDSTCVERTAKAADGRTDITYTVRAMTGIYDFTLTDCPAYPDTSVQARQLAEPEAAAPEPPNKNWKEQVRQMRSAAKSSI